MAFRGNTRAAVEDNNSDLFMIPTQLYGRFAGVLDGVVQQVGHHPFQAKRPPQVHQMPGATEGDINRLVAIVIDQGLRKLCQVKLGGLLQPRIIAKELQTGVDRETDAAVAPGRQ